MKITSPDSPELSTLCEKLAELAGTTDDTGVFPYEQIRLCGQAGVYEWFLDPAWGGQRWSDADVVRGYLALSQADLTTTFVITQRTGACRRIAGSDNQQLKEKLLPALASGDSFATVGISHLTTSGRHLAKPMLTAEAVDGGYLLNGRAPWVTGGEAAQHLVLGVSHTAGGEPTGEEALVALPSESEGVSIGEPFKLVAVTASSTGPIVLENVFVAQENVIADSTPAIMQSGRGGRTGGYETSTLAIGLASAAIQFLAEEASNRDDLRPALDKFNEERSGIITDLLDMTEGHPNCSSESLRTRANSFALRSTQAALSAAKGRGFVAGHPVGRWCREALFFMVWSCPQPVANANLCELAGIAE